jgi:tetratricopeptide (TPR) repeat protein
MKRSLTTALLLFSTMGLQFFPSANRAWAAGGMEQAISKSKVLRGYGYASCRLMNKQAIVDVFHFKGDLNASARKLAISLAKVMVNYAPAQFYIVSVRFHGEANEYPYQEYIVASRDITSLNAGSINYADMVATLPGMRVEGVGALPDVAGRYINIADEMTVAGKYWEAEQVLTQLSREGMVRHETSSDYLTSLTSLANAFDNWGDPDKGEACLLKAYELGNNEFLGFDQEAMQHAVSALVKLQIQEQRYSLADEELRHILQRPEVLAGSDVGKASRAHYLTLLGHLQQKIGQLNDALAQGKVAWELRGGQQNAKTISLLEFLGDVSRDLGKTKEAKDYYRQAKSACDKAILAHTDSERIDYLIYSARVKQIDEKLKRVQ